jgi:hypothetical protein
MSQLRCWWFSIGKAWYLQTLFYQIFLKAGLLKMLEWKINNVHSSGYTKMFKALLKCLKTQGKIHGQ